MIMHNLGRTEGSNIDIYRESQVLPHTLMWNQLNEQQPSRLISVHSFHIVNLINMYCVSGSLCVCDIYSPDIESRMFPSSFLSGDVSVWCSCRVCVC